MINILYFARLKDILGCGEETLPYSNDINTAGKLLAVLKARGEPWHDTLSNSQLLVAINQEMASPESALSSGDEVAFFPPVTGG